MSKILAIKDKIKKFNKQIQVSGDKSLSIRWVLLASQAIGKSTAFNILRSEDVLSTLNCLRKLGVKVNLFKNNHHDEDLIKYLKMICRNTVERETSLIQETYLRKIDLQYLNLK